MANESLRQSTFALGHNVATRKVNGKDIRVKYQCPVIRAEANPELAMQELVLRYGKQNCLYALQYGLALHLNEVAISKVVKPESETKGKLAELKISIAATNDPQGFMEAAKAGKVNDFVREYFERFPEQLPKPEQIVDETIPQLTEEEAREIKQEFNALKKGLGWTRGGREQD